ncbi:NAD(P)/FAD-dependent oxidoreductase [Amycolatopsis thailandensis]|uniref:NAD(P)/FAD-dependent oxidoreductase n=1 Tax=Amycolatopsis thailandensis TaxID=589330 RepID=UPI00362E2085
MTEVGGAPPHVVLLGGGYLSIWTYRSLRRKLGRRVRITLVAPATAHAFHGFTAEVLSGELPPAAQLSPFNEALRHATHVRGLARRVDRDARTVLVDLSTGGEKELHYDYLVIGTGQYESVDTVPGMSEHAFRLRDAGRVGELVDHLDQCVRSAGGTEDATERRRLLSVVVAGGGMAGVEASAAIAQRLNRATRGSWSGQVVLVNTSDAIAREMSPRLRGYVRAELSRSGVTVRSFSRVGEVDRNGVRLEDGDRLGAATVVATIGNRPHPLPGLDDLPLDERGALRTDRKLQIADRIWGGGDAASVPLASGEPCPVDAAWAIGQGAWLGTNLARVIRRRPQRDFTWKSVGVTAGFGRGHAALRAWGLNYRGWVAWFARAAFFGYYLPSRRQTLRVLGMVVLRRSNRSPSRAGLAPTTGAKTG